MHRARAGKERGRAARACVSLARDERGATAVEFTFVAGPLMALIVAVLQMTLLFLAQQNLETASQRAVRQLMTGTAQSAGMTQAQFKTLVCSKLSAFMKCANVMVDIEPATNFSSADVTAPTITYDASGNPNNAFVYNPGGAGTINVAKVMYVWKTAAGPLGFDLSNMSSNNRLLISTSVFKTEPYS